MSSNVEPSRKLSLFIDMVMMHLPLLIFILPLSLELQMLGRKLFKPLLCARMCAKSSIDPLVEHVIVTSRVAQCIQIVFFRGAHGNLEDV